MVHSTTVHQHKIVHKYFRAIVLYVDHYPRLTSGPTLLQNLSGTSSLAEHMICDPDPVLQYIGVESVSTQIFVFDQRIPCFRTRVHKVHIICHAKDFHSMIT